MTDYNHSKPDFPEDIKQTLLNETAESSPGLEDVLPEGEETNLVESSPGLEDALPDGEATNLVESSSGLEYELPDGEVTYLVDEATEYDPWPRQYMEKTPT